LAISRDRRDDGAWSKCGYCHNEKYTWHVHSIEQASAITREALREVDLVDTLLSISAICGNKEDQRSGDIKAWAWGYIARQLDELAALAIRHDLYIHNRETTHGPNKGD